MYNVIHVCIYLKYIQFSIKINKINENRNSLKTAALIFIDFQYKSINC